MLLVSLTDNIQSIACLLTKSVGMLTQYKIKENQWTFICCHFVKFVNYHRKVSSLKQVSMCNLFNINT